MKEQSKRIEISAEKKSCSILMRVAKDSISDVTSVSSVEKLPTLNVSTNFPAPLKGAIAYSTNDNVIWFANGSIWQPVSSGGAAGITFEDANVSLIGQTLLGFEDSSIVLSAGGPTDCTVQIFGGSSVFHGTGTDNTIPRTVRIGDGAVLDTTESVAVGAEAGAIGAESTAVGAISSALVGAVGIGFRCQAAAGNVACGHTAIALQTNSTAVGTSSLASLADCSAFGQNARALAIDSSAIGSDSTAGNQRSTAFGKTANAAGIDSVSFGANSVANALQTTSVGASANCTLSDSTAVGFNANCSARRSVAVGKSSSSTVEYGLALGHESLASVFSAGATSGFSLSVPLADIQDLGAPGPADRYMRVRIFGSGADQGVFRIHLTKEVI